MNTCPHCGAELKPGATFCRHCGSDKNTGWKDGAEFADEELPDYDEILENEFGEVYNPDGTPAGKKKKNGFGGVVGTIAAIIVALAFVATMIF